MWEDLQLLGTFILNCMTSIGNLCLSGILVFTFGLFILELIVKFFRRIL